MDSIFDEDADEVGGEVEAYCPSPRCKADTTHTIISMYEDEVRRVQCVVCGDVHAYRKPRGDAVEEASGDVPKRRQSHKPPWEDALQRASDQDLANCRPYSIRDTYEEGDLVSHPVFDIGTVTELLPDNKVEITFKEGPRILVHNRGDLASRMPGISETPPPREAKKKKRAKKPGRDEPLPPDHKPKYSVTEALELARQAATSKTDGGVPTPPAKPPVKGGKPVVPAPVAAPVAAKGKPPVAAPVAAKGKPPVAPVAAKGKAPAAAPPAPAAKGKAAPPAPAAKGKAPAKPVPAKPAPAAKPAKAAKPAAKAAKPAAKAAKPAPAKKPAAKAAKPAPAKKPAPASASGGAKKKNKKKK